MFIYFCIWVAISREGNGLPFPGDVKDTGSILGWGRSPGEGNGNPLQFSCLENPMDRGAWQATVHRITKESDTTEQLHMDIQLCVCECVLNYFSCV